MSRPRVGMVGRVIRDAPCFSGHEYFCISAVERVGKDYEVRLAYLEDGLPVPLTFVEGFKGPIFWFPWDKLHRYELDFTLGDIDDPVLRMRLSAKYDKAPL